MTSPHPTNATGNISLANSPFIWGNIALLAGVPWLLALSMAGLAVGDTVFPEWFEIFLLGFPAIAFVAWVHWQQPISPFSLWFVAKPSESLSDRDRQILTLVKQHSSGWYVTGWIATAVAIVMSAVFCKMYISAPLAQSIAPFPAGLRLFGIIWAEIFFLLSNVLLQAGVSAVRIKLTAESELIGLKPFAVEKIKNKFTIIGWKSPQILKFFAEDAIAETTEEAVAEPVKSVEAIQALKPTDTITEAEQIISEPQIAAILDKDVVQESEELTAEEFVSESEVDSFLDITDTDSAKAVETENIIAIADVSLDNDLVKEVETVEELEISTIVAEEPAFDTISGLEIEQVIDQEIVQEPEELNFFELVEDVESYTEVVSVSTETTMEPVIEEAKIELILDEVIVENTDELEAFETNEDPELTISEIPDISLEPKLEELEQVESLLETSDAFPEEKSTEDRGELESLETIESPEVDIASNTPVGTTELEFIKAPDQTAIADFLIEIESDLKITDSISELEIIAEVDEETALDESATSTEQNLVATEIKTQDFDDELDELIAFNAYVENILNEYLKDPDEESKNVGTKAEVISIQESMAIVEEVSTDEESLDEEIQNLIDPSIVYDPAIIEDLNINDKSNQPVIEQIIENISKPDPDPEIDEFADLEALLNARPENPDTED
ncbi:MAG: hypothetical protein DCF20_00495 [Pseudanabaena sp.]|nr:MAG: hypothetical protein DCF20_00495 [Pseudanabaena sp.]